MQLGIEADGQRDPVTVEVPNAWAAEWIAAAKLAHVSVKRCEHHAIRTGALELPWAAVKADPVPAVRKLMATLGEAQDETLIRHFIENYPGAQS